MIRRVSISSSAGVSVVAATGFPVVVGGIVAFAVVLMPSGEFVVIAGRTVVVVVVSTRLLVVPMDVVGC